VFVLPNGWLLLLDFGSTGDLDEPMRESLILLLEAVVKGDARAASEAYVEMAEARDVNRAGLLVDMKAALYEIRWTNTANVLIGDAFDSLLRAGSRNGAHNPAEFVLLTRAFVILESMTSELAPGYDDMQSFREEISRLIAKHFSPVQVKEKSTKLARELERLLFDTPGDTRHACSEGSQTAIWVDIPGWKPWERALGAISNGSHLPSLSRLW
jgi:ubiquinone biosynthesis protein